jgi:hypothetical protein
MRKRIPDADSAFEDKTRIPEADSANEDKTRNCVKKDEHQEWWHQKFPDAGARFPDGGAMQIFPWLSVLK